MNKKDVLHDIVRNLPTDNIPIPFVSMIKLKDSEGNRRIIKGSELLDFFENQHNYESVETRIVVNTARIFQAIVREVDFVYEEVERRQKARLNN